MPITASISVRLPSNLRKFANGVAAIELRGGTIGELLGDLATEYPELKSAITNADGQMLSHLQLFVNGQSARDLDDIRTRVTSADEVLLVAPVAGG